MNIHDTNILANAAQSGAIDRLKNDDRVGQLNVLQSETFRALAALTKQAAKERNDATAAAAGDELERQLGVAS